jgi:hypothetical protein
MSMTKKEWRKPEVKKIAAGSAELNPGSTTDDGDPGVAVNNS